MSLRLGNPHHVVDVPLVLEVDAVLLRDVLGGIFVAHKASSTSVTGVAWVTHVAVEELTSMHLELQFNNSSIRHQLSTNLSPVLGHVRLHGKKAWINAHCAAHLRANRGEVDKALVTTAPFEGGWPSGLRPGEDLGLHLRRV